MIKRNAMEYCANIGLSRTFTSAPCWLFLLLLIFDREIHIASAVFACRTASTACPSILKEGGRRSSSGGTC